MAIDLPSGTVTFLFTDIEGSTKLAQSQPAAFEGFRARHHDILKSAIGSHNGYTFQIIGDAFCTAFHTASDALGAAVQSQCALNKAEWGNTPIKIRMGIHTGRAEVQPDGQYQGYLAMSRVQRLMSAAYGGQVLITLATQQLVREDLPEQVSLRDLGERRLKDLIQPEHVFQLVIPDLPADFPPIKTLDAHPNNLPIQLTSFIGREQEMVRVKELLAGARLLTLIGAGGAGKTRLALQVAADLINEFPDGVWFVDLAQLSDPVLVPHSVAIALGLQLQSGRTIQLALTEYLRDRNCLLLFDNCEHLIDASARLADALVRGCPNLKILATSREGFNLAGEVNYSVPSLAIPSLESPNAQTLMQYEAVRLFIDRAVMIQPNFAVTNQNTPAVAQICYHLDGIPLAIELAAARVNVLSVEQISERLVDRFRLLNGGSRTALPRQQTLRALIDWSYSLLSPAECILFARLSIFAGGWILEAAESICAGDVIESFDVLDTLQNLAAKSLVVVGEGVEGRVRYHMLETIRQYAHEEMVNSGQLRMFHDRHLDWFLDFEEQSRPKLFSSKQVVMLNRLDAELDNFRAALAWSMETAVEKGLRLAAGLYRFWTLRGYWFERLDWLNKLLAQPEALALTPTRAYALVARGDMELSQGEFADAEKSFAESLQIYRQMGDKNGIAEALCELARLSVQQGNFLRVGELTQESLEISRKMGDKFQISQALNLLAHVLRAQGDRTKANEMLNESMIIFSQMIDMGSIQNFFASPESQNAYFSSASSEQDQGNFERARKLFEDGLAFFRKTGSSHEIAWFLRYLANLSRREGDLSGAQTLYQESLQIVQDLKDKYCTAHALDGLAQVENQKCNYEQAETLACQALDLCEQVGSKPRIAQVQWTLGLAMLHTDPSGAEQMLKSSLTVRNKLRNKSDIAESLEALAKMNSFDGAFERATKLFAAASVLHEPISYAMTPAESTEFDRDLSALRAELGGEAFAAAWDEGRAITLEQSIKLALAEKPI